MSQAIDAVLMPPLQEKTSDLVSTLCEPLTALIPELLQDVLDPVRAWSEADTHIYRQRDREHIMDSCGSEPHGTLEQCCPSLCSCAWAHALFLSVALLFSAVVCSSFLVLLFLSGEIMQNVVTKIETDLVSRLVKPIQEASLQQAQLLGNSGITKIN
jgi:hypothetical protein